ncbi:MAG TPA: CpsB/CapC family capsule biosynthesis tyrosine phosphatase [Solirubrobacteraceae bacterium]|nr:CpsB/CapC family capsule biosynthesis tyrosine phosphatase [Solirubrobacteraceae bacterium]
MSLVDLHLHLLPGVDDGPADEAASLEHARRLASAGVREATVTPHVGHPEFPLDVATIAERTRALQAALDAEGVRLRVRPGGELHPAGAATLRARELEHVAQGPVGARWVLAEVPFAGIVEPFLEGCARVRSLGFGLVIAHPERAARFLDAGLRALRGELQRGALLQVNVCSLLGRQGEAAHAGALRLVQGGLAHVLASDGHGAGRAHTLADGIEPARRAGASVVRAWQLTAANPAFLLRAGVPRDAPASAAVPWRSPHARAVGRLLTEARRAAAL